MRKRLVMAALPLAVSAAVLAYSGSLTAAGPAELADPGALSEPPVAKGYILVSPRAGLSTHDFEKAVRPHGGTILGRLGDLEVFVVQLPEHASERAVAALLANNPHFKFAEPDQLVAPGALPNDTYFGSQWHLQMVQAPAAWDYSLGNGVTVAILDSGVNAAHPDLQGRLVPGWNFYENNSNTADVNGHGTRVAGVVAAASNNGTGVASLAWNAMLMPVRISGADGYAYWSTIASGLNWAANNGARVANISFMAHTSSTVQSAAQYMKSKGGLVINSAGNTGAFDGTAASDAMISVSATNSSDTRTSWATWGNHVDLSAPGEGIWTTSSSGSYGAVSGTSFSSPLTAGVVALMMSANPSLAPSQIESILKSTAVDLGTVGYDQYYGYGRVNAASAVQVAAQTRVSDTQPPTVAISSPVAGTVKGLFPVDVSAADNVSVSRVELFVNGGLIASDSTAPYGFSWDTTKIADGSANLVARAYDATGNSAASSPVSVTVSNAVVTAVVDTTPPTVAISNPADGSKVSGWVSINVSSADASGIASLSLAIDGAVKFSGNVGSTSYKWNTKSVKSGAHVITAVATDKAGNRAARTINVSK